MRAIPLIANLKNYSYSLFIGDLVAGLVTAFIAVPQTMAYAQLAGLPPELGLYSALVPMLIYALFGSSQTLVIGPAALISLMVSSAVINTAPSSEAEYILISVNLTLLIGFYLMVMNILKLGRIADFISKPVITGFTSASAIIIAVSQFSLITGISREGAQSVFGSLYSIIANLGQLNYWSVVLSGVALLVLKLSKPVFSALALKYNFSKSLSLALVGSGPVLVVILSIVYVQSLSINNQQVLQLVGAVPNSLPSFGIDWLNVQLWPQLSTSALSIALICFLTSISTGSTLARKAHRRVKPNQELFALGLANMGAALSGTFALAASVSRSMVNYSAGAISQVSNIVSAFLILLTILFLAPLFSYLPQAVLGTIVIVSVIPMIAWPNFRLCWRFNRADAISLVVTFLSTLIVGVEVGIWAGIASSVVLFIHRSSRPHIAQVGQASNGHFRNIERLDVETIDEAVFLRIDENLYFANVQYVEQHVMQVCAQNPKTKHLVLVLSSASSFDESALEALENMIVNLRSRGICLHLSNMKGILLDQLKQTELFELLKPGQTFYTAADAMVFLKKEQTD